MNERLRNARIAAGFASATDAINYCHWRGRTYRAHENGQNNFDPNTAAEYAKAYGVSTAWLLLGEDQSVAHLNKKRPPSKIHRHDCIEQIHELSALLRKMGPNDKLLQQLEACIASLRRHQLTKKKS